MKQITPHLWFDGAAQEAAEFYCALFEGAAVTDVTTLHDVPTPSGDCKVVSFDLPGQPFVAIDGGPEFSVNPSISFMLNFDPSRDGNAREKLDRAWAALSDGGRVFMALDAYPFSPRYGWVQDRFGISWQLILTDPAGEPRPFVIPTLMFAGAVCGKCEEATDFYLSAFPRARRGLIARYPSGMPPDTEGTIMFTDFRINGQWFAAMDSARVGDVPFTEGISLILPCEDQAEIDRYWAALSAVPAAEQCGWLKDRYGLSWQAYPEPLTGMLRGGTPDQKARVTQAFLGMKKCDIAALQAAFDGA